MAAHEIAPKSEVFPLVRRPFEGRLYPGPRDVRSFLTRSKDFTKEIKDNKGKRRVFDADASCFLGAYKYLDSRDKPKDDVVRKNCYMLTSAFPFVKFVRGPGSSYCKEDLMLNGSFVRSAENIPVC